MLASPAITGKNAATRGVPVRTTLVDTGATLPIRRESALSVFIAARAGTILAAALRRLHLGGCNAEGRSAPYANARNASWAIRPCLVMTSRRAMPSAPVLHARRRNSKAGSAFLATPRHCCPPMKKFICTHYLPLRIGRPVRVPPLQASPVPPVLSLAPETVSLTFQHHDGQSNASVRPARSGGKHPFRMVRFRTHTPRRGGQIRRFQYEGFGNAVYASRCAQMI